MLAAHPATCDAVAALLGHPVEWDEPDATGAGGGHGEVRGLLDRHPQAAEAVAGLLAPVGAASC
ncbi:hypothetical protein ACFYTC_38115 [Actinomadura nitritigenes]|uniref:hypothetical protein n=1 Tax=Actinomadura nitritigenes TaxID=134602 RepID=UPI0036AEF4C3